MSGKINVNSELSKGSNFFFNITATPIPVEQYKSNSHKRTTELLKKVRGARILVTDKYTSTVTFVQHLLPGTLVDGVCSVQELLACNSKDYSIIVIGLFLSLDSEFSARLDEIKLFLESAQCVLVMHYPTNLIGEVLGKNSNNINKGDNNNQQEHAMGNCATQPIAVLDNNNSLIINEEASADTIKKDSQHCAVVRISVPLRQKTLLRKIVEILNHTLPISQTPSSLPMLQQYRSMCKKPARPGARKVQDKNEGVITEEERTQFRKMHILIAEGVVWIIIIDNINKILIFSVV